MPMPTSTDEMRITDRIRLLRRAGLLLSLAVLAAAVLAVVNICPIHSY